MRPELDIELGPLQPDLEALTERLRAFCTGHALPDGIWQRFALAFDEVISNIASHGNPTHPIRVRVRLHADEIRATVTDDGIAFNPLLMPDPDTTSGVDERPIGGLGIFLLRKTMDRVAYRRFWQHNYLSFAKRVASDTPTTREEDRGDQ